MNRHGWNALAAVISIGVVMTVGVAWAAAGPNVDTGVFDTVVTAYSKKISDWKDAFKAAATYLYWTLVLISMIWTGGQMALRQADAMEFFGEFLRFTLSVGFFWWLLDNGPEISKAIIDSMRQLAGKASGLGEAVNASALMDSGFEIFGKIIDNLSFGRLAISIASIILGFVLLIVIALVSVQMIILIITAWILSYAGIFLLGFGGGKWTTDIAINYYKTVLQVGIQLLAMTLLIGVGGEVLTSYAAGFVGDDSGMIKKLAVILVAAFVFWQLFSSVPGILSGIVVNAGLGGGGGLTGMAASVMQAGQAAVMAAAGIGAVAQAGASMVAGGAGAAAGGAQAVQAAFGAAQEAAKSGTGMFEGGAWGGGGSPATSSIGRGVQMAAETGSQLAQSAGNAVTGALKGAVADAKDAFGERVKNSVGGNLADDIRGPDDLDDGGKLSSGVATQKAIVGQDPEMGSEAAISPTARSLSAAENSANGSSANGAVPNEARAFVSGGPAGAHPEHWSQSTGGVSALSADQLAQAQAKYEEWPHNDRYDFGDYVNYVQEKAAEKRELEGEMV